MMEKDINHRKTEHIRLCLTDQVEGVNKSTGLEGISFIHNALPEINFHDINIETSFLGKSLKAPFLVSSMTGGSELATEINVNLAAASEEKGWAIGLGSTRALLESSAHEDSFLIRKQAKTVPVIANLGAVQFNYGYGVDECQRIVDATEADSLVLHLNSLQEIVQDGGDLNRWAIGLGSTRALLESSAHEDSFLIRKQAKTVPVIANLGAVQFNYGYGVDECQRIVDATEADSLVLHLNSLQEIVQDGGDLNFENLLPKIEEVCKKLSVPVGVKEVGFGIDGTVAEQLHNVGVTYIDVAGAGGTSWSQVEKLRTEDPLRKLAAEAFNSWGIPTKDCIVSVKSKLPTVPIVASGGMKTGLDAAKAITIGANIVGFARTLLQAATESVESVLKVMDQIEFELKMTMFGIGADSIQALQNTNRVTIMGKSLLEDN